MREPARRFIETFAQALADDLRNTALRDRLADPACAEALFRELQWTFARLAFLLAAEARSLLGRSDNLRDLLASLLKKLEQPANGDSDGSLWTRWRHACVRLSGSTPMPGRLPALASSLFDTAHVALLERATISDDAFLQAIRVLCPLTPDALIDWRRVLSSHIGSAYEFLLGLHPAGAPRDRALVLEPRRRSARSGAGAFYTPPRLVQHLMDESLDPLVRQTLAPCVTPEQRRDVLLALRICDPACGCGNFLVAAAERLTDHLLAVCPGCFTCRSEAYRSVLDHSIHGVDIDPLAVELARAALWLDMAQPEAHMSFLESRVICGDALVGAQSRLVAQGIPDQALQSRAGDVPAALARARRANRAQRRARIGSPGLPGATASSPCAFDTWCAAFFAHPSGPAGRFITTADLDDALTGRFGASCDVELAQVVRSLADQHRFVHWELAFPQTYADRCPGFDLVIGNPPFLNQLETATATSRARAALLGVRTDGLIKRYADEASAFLAVGFRLLKPRDGSRLAFVQPQSVLSASDIAPLRRALLEEAVIDAIWLSGGRMFVDASVNTCALVLRRSAQTEFTPCCSVGPEFEPLAAVTLLREHLREADTWSELAASAFGTPGVRLGSTRTLADVATATADFRDQYYGLDGYIVESADLTTSQQSDWQSFPPIITSGLIDLAACLWSRTPTRLLRRVWRAPRLDRQRMESHGELSDWVDARLIPKILLATQTRVIEVCVDEHARLLPSVPVVTITPRDSSMLWLVAAALASPVAAAEAARRYAGSGLHHHVVKLSARQALTLPLPTDEPAWRRAAAEFQTLHSLSSDSPDRCSAMRRFAGTSCEAFGLAGTSALVAWWLERQRLVP